MDKVQNSFAGLLQQVEKAIGPALPDTSFLNALISDSAGAALTSSFGKSSEMEQIGKVVSKGLAEFHSPIYKQIGSMLDEGFLPTYQELTKLLTPSLEKLASDLALVHHESMSALAGSVHDTVGKSLVSDSVASTSDALHTIDELINPPINFEAILPSPFEALDLQHPLDNVELSEPGPLIAEVQTNGLTETSTWLSDNWPFVLMFMMQVVLSILLALRTGPHAAALTEQLRELNELLLRLVEING